MKKIIGILVALILVVSTFPSLDISTQITWTTYLGIPLIILTGSAGVAFVTKRFEAILLGALLSILWPVLFGIVRSVLATL
jgi:hypothetical protein